MDFKAKRERLIKHLIDMGALKTPRIIEAFRSIPRHLFVLKKYLSQAYEDYALPSIHSQTISQPYTISIMIESINPKLGEKILEIGTGSGYNAALISHCVGKKGKVITIELDSDLVEFARKNLKKVGIKNVKVICGDGKLGYPEESPYNKSIVTAACDEIPKPIIEQTKIKGRIIAPVNSFYGQRMILVIKESKNKLKKEDLGSFVFVPLR